jgi:hypothetical protein
MQKESIELGLENLSYLRYTQIHNLNLNNLKLSQMQNFTVPLCSTCSKDSRDIKFVEFGQADQKIWILEVGSILCLYIQKYPLTWHMAVCDLLIPLR